MPCGVTSSFDCRSGTRAAPAAKRTPANCRVLGHGRKHIAVGQGLDAERSVTARRRRHGMDRLALLGERQGEEVMRLGVLRVDDRNRDAVPR
jgi:hypothetical protein